MFKCVVNETRLPGLYHQPLSSPSVLFCSSTHRRGVPIRQFFCFAPPHPTPPPDSARRQSIQRRRRKVVIWGREKVLIREARAKKLGACPAFLPPSPSVAPFFRVPGGDAQWAAYLCCCVPTLCCALLLSEAMQHGARGHAGMPIMHCGNCDCFWFKWFQMRLLEVHSKKQLVAVVIDMHKKSVDAVL